MFAIIKELQRSSIVLQIQIIDMLDEPTVQYLKCYAEIIDRSRLYITESYSIGRSKYSYHWQDSQNQLIIRRDNSPHHPHLSTFPHHRHESGTVLESPRILINEEIEKRLKTSGKMQ